MLLFLTPHFNTECGQAPIQDMCASEHLMLLDWIELPMISMLLAPCSATALMQCDMTLTAYESTSR